MTEVLIIITILAAFIGYEYIRRVPRNLHTPLMSATNAMSGVIVVGAILVMVEFQESALALTLGGIATLLAGINVFGGYLITQRLLKMFQSDEKGKAKRV